MAAEAGQYDTLVALGECEDGIPVAWVCAIDGVASARLDWLCVI